MSGKKRDPIYHELERISHKDLKSYRSRSKDLNTYLREHFQYFAEQRKEVFPSLLDSIRQNCVSYQFVHYQRAASFKYCLNPLSARGSVLSETGGRFNIGDINPNIPKFPALYLAKDKETAIKEVFQIGAIGSKQSLSEEDFALIKERSMCVVAVSGYLEQVLDLTVKDNLKDFFNAIKHIKLPKSLLGPEEIGWVLDTYGIIWEAEHKTKEQGLDPQKRLEYHKKHSLPAMECLRAWALEKQRAENFEENSALGKAINYLLKHYDRLTLFCRKAKVPLDNNRMEETLKMIIRGRKLSHFYKTAIGAGIANVLTSIIATAYRANTELFSYLVAAQRYHKHVKENPQGWLPWTYEETLRNIEALNADKITEAI